MLSSLKSNNVISSFKVLKGNTFVTIAFQPMWSIPYVFYNFYLSLYMKNMGITGKEIGFLISIGFISGTILSLFSGVINDTLGKKKTILIFDLIAWPGSILIYLFANSFWMFALAAILNSSCRVASVSWNLMIIEKADAEQRIASYNILSTIGTVVGIFTPVAGILVKTLGIITAERAMLTFAFISVFTEIILRNHFYTESRTTQSKESLCILTKKIFNFSTHVNTLKQIRGNVNVIIVMCLIIIFNMHATLGTLGSMYFAPYMTDVLKVDKSIISTLGGINSLIMLLVLTFINPTINKYRLHRSMILGMSLQLCAVVLLMLAPQNGFFIVLVSILLSAVGICISRTFLDSLLAEASEGIERSGVYSLLNTVLSIFSAVAGFVSGYIYMMNARLIYAFSAVILVTCIMLLLKLKRNMHF